MATDIKCIGLIGKHGDSRVTDTIELLSAYLLKKGIKVILDEDTATMGNSSALTTGNRFEIGTECDIAIIVGGDGTLLNAARTLADANIALVGINLGRLGFLVDISPDTMLENLDEILKGNYQAEERFLLHSTVVRDGKHIGDCSVLNDVVIHKWNVARMIEVETYIDDQFVNLTRSDGIIVSTPTGSTAYALSAGGPILHPSLDAIIIAPICPHTMSNRPIVIQGDKQITLIIRSRNSAQVTCDGQTSHELMTDDQIVIRKKERPIRLLHPASHNHFEILRAKLGWSEFPRGSHR